MCNKSLGVSLDFVMELSCLGWAMKDDEVGHVMVSHDERSGNRNVMTIKERFSCSLEAHSKISRFWYDWIWG